jgi:uncharacterized protein (DUF934 family)
MPLLINQRIVTEDPWQLIDQAALDEGLSLPDSGPVAVPLTWYRQHREALQQRNGPLGVIVNGDDDLTALYADHSQLDLVAIEFPTFRDGRGFSIAKQLVRSGFAQQIRAIGHVTRDRLALMQSSGFNAFDISDEGFHTDHLQAFSEISVNYQGTTADPRPAFSQRT